MGRRKRNSAKKTANVTRKTCEAKRKNLNFDKEEVTEREETEKQEEEGRENRSPQIVVTTIDVHARLKLPLVRSMQYLSLNDNDDEDEEEEEEEDTVELNFCPRFVFASNLCLICMKRSRETCEFCGMVSYCTDEHREQGWSKHRDLCEILSKVCATGGGLSPLPELTPDDYRTYRLKLIDIVECRLGRPLELWEKEIILYPRVCRSCRLFSESLRCCPTCEFELYCEDHEDGHTEWCREYQVYRRVLLLQHENGHVDPMIPDTVRQQPLRLPDNFDSLMAQLYRGSIYYRNMDCYTYCSLSHISTIPLTTLYSVQVSCQDWNTVNTLLVHVIGAEFQFECINLHVWEKFFLHLLPNLKCLTLMFIGPELRLPSVPLNLLAAVKMCSVCKSSGRSVSVSLHPGKFYHDFCRSKRFVKPNLVCLFNPGLYRETGFEGKDTWPETIREFCKTGVPVCVTSYTRHEIPREMIRIKSIADTETILEPRRNPFASIKPDRNFVSDDTVPIIYKNYYVAIVRGNL